MLNTYKYKKIDVSFILFHFHASSVVLQYDRRNKPFGVAPSQYKMIKWTRALKGEGVLKSKVYFLNKPNPDL